MPSLITSPAKKLCATLAAPSDKSISHRALIFAAMAMGTSRIKNLLSSDDVLATATALKTLGVDIEENTDGHTIHGNGVGGLRSPERVLDFRNSGTGARLMLGVLATHPFISSFTGDESLNNRPMDRVIKPLQEFGAEAN
ncbi:MAG: 3-phosphoshikimate 1-carboxyvinyltransferase, partial [Hyphomicrobiales bacterium]|nr:3-phosphoshikimate 1-carboxyvinyltransferase [Hyphomicrobiales bacterium]